MKVVTAFDLGVLIARSNFTKIAENPLITATAAHSRDNNSRMMNAYRQSQSRPAPLNIPGAAANAFSGLGSAIRTGAQMAASPPQLPSWALNYKFNDSQPVTPSAAPAFSSRVPTSRQSLPSYGAGGDPLEDSSPPPPASLDPAREANNAYFRNLAANPPVDPAREANNAYFRNLAAKRNAPVDPLMPKPIDMTNPANAYAVEMAKQRAYYQAQNAAYKSPNVARR